MEKREFNFLLAWEREQARVSGQTIRIRPKTLAALIAGILVLTLAAAAPWLWEYKLDRELADLNRKIAAFGRIESKVQRLIVLQTQKAKEQQLLEAVKKNTKDPGPLLDQLSKLLPQGTKVSTFSLQADNTLNLSVSLPTPVDVARFWSSLRDSGLFQEVEIKIVSLEDKAQELALTLKLKGQGKP